MSEEIYTYRWTSDWPAVIAGHTTPEGTGVDAFPGQNFSTIAPVDSPFAKPANAAAKKAAKDLAAQAEQPSTDDDEIGKSFLETAGTTVASGEQIAKDLTIDLTDGTESAEPEGATP